MQCSSCGFCELTACQRGACKTVQVFKSAQRVGANSCRATSLPNGPVEESHHHARCPGDTDRVLYAGTGRQRIVCGRLPRPLRRSGCGSCCRPLRNDAGCDITSSTISLLIVFVQVFLSVDIAQLCRMLVNR